MRRISIRILDARLSLDQIGYGSAGAAGIDLRACIDKPITVRPGETVAIPCGFAMHLNNTGLSAMILPRSGLGVKKGIVIGNLVGLIDSDYQGQIFAAIWNRNHRNMIDAVNGYPDSDSYTIEPMERIAQMVIVPVVQVALNLVDAFPESERGAGGFGSTGKQ